MKYYLLNRSLKKKDVGVAFGQTSEIWDLDFIKGIPYIKQLENLPNYHGKLRNDEFPSLEPRIKFELTEKGKKTDLVHIPNINCNGMLVSPKFKELLEKFNLMEHRFYPGKLKVGGFFFEYFWFHPVIKNLKWIDFSKSIFSIMDTKLIIKENKQMLFLGGEEEYHNFRLNNRNHVRMKKIFLNIEFFNSLDFFYLPGLQFGNKYFISEPLMKAIKKEKITGVEIKEQEII